MCKAKLRFVALPGDFKDNVCTRPLGCVFEKVEVILQHVPDDLLTGHEFGDLECAAMNILEAVKENGAKPICVALNIFRPPAANIADGFEDFFRILVYCEGSRCNFDYP